MEEVQYKIGYLCRVFEDVNWEDIKLLQICKEKCEKLIVGIPTDALFFSLLEKCPPKTCIEIQEILMLLKAVDEVIIVDKGDLAIQSNYQQIGYDCYFYGTEYGRQYLADRKLLKENKVSMVSLVPNKIVETNMDTAFMRMLEDSFDEGKIVLFGTGKYFDYYMQKYGQLYPPAYAVDNSSEKWNTIKQNIMIKSPDILNNEDVNHTLVILCCREFQEIRQQLLEMGEFDYRILQWEGTISIIEEYTNLIQNGKKYKKGYLMGDFADIGVEEIELLQRCKRKCEKLVIGLPADELMARMTDNWPENTYEEKKQNIEKNGLADEIITVDTDNISVMDSYQQNRYDVYFYGTEYGRIYQEDSIFLEEQNVDMISVQPSRIQERKGEDPTWRALQNAVSDRKIVLFGTGKYFDYYIEKYGEHFPPVFALDNDETKWNTQKRGIMIKNPDALRAEKSENTVIMICCKDYQNILKQILKIGNFDYRILLYNRELAILEEYSVILREEKEYMKKAHSILMKLIIEFDTACKRYGLHYYVMGGSLIGVVRHKGLIPWDDDIDVAMFRKDYEILREKAHEIWPENSEFLFLDYDQLGNGTFYDFLTRMVYMKEELPTRLFKKVEGKARPDIQNKLVMDIYVMENADNNEKKHKLVTTLMKGVYALSVGHRAKIDYSEYAFLPKPAFYGVKIAIAIGHFIPIKWLFSLFEKLRGYARKSDCDYVFESNNGAINYMPWRYDKKIYGKGKTLPMCGYEVMVPDDCDGLLKAKGYGDYMSFPPINSRKPSHSAKASGIIW